MNHERTQRAIWGSGNRPLLCENCGKEDAQVCLSNRFPAPDIPNPIYVCRKCLYRLIVRAMQVHGLIVLDLPGILEDALESDARDAIYGEQWRKERDWNN